MLKFSKANAKTQALANDAELAEYLQGNRKIYSLDLLSGWSCPHAKDCLSKAIVQDNGKRKIKDGRHTQFRCFSASQEVQYTNVYNSRKHNFDLLRACKNTSSMVKLINDGLPKNAGIVRIHVAGDFFNQKYFRAWCLVAAINPNTLFYAYTKSLRFWHEDKLLVPDNLVLTASYGGRDDWRIDEFDMRFAKVVYSEQEAHNLDLAIDHDDTHAAKPSLSNQSFALMLHGTQPKGSEAADALKVLKRDKVRHSYSRKQATV